VASRDNSATIVTRLRDEIPGNRGSSKGADCSFSQRSDWVWGSPSLLSNSYPSFFPQEEGDRGVKLTIHLHPVSRLRMHGATPLLPIRLHAMVFIWTQGKLYIFTFYYLIRYKDTSVNSTVIFG
jgi:hypothetical protein